MTRLLFLFFFIVFLWTGHSAGWMVDYRTGMAQ
jgi:hypothetical protein